ncbi:hypothetical protein [Vibrio bivalvicida]|uniref:Uncharacterized protein n=1 Tax=Vibrio bivalvicida TaxID=1276888 RepID=A0ABV4MDD5_9VIBR
MHTISLLVVALIAFVAGSIGLGESITLTAAISSLLVLGGIALIFTARAKS